MRGFFLGTGEGEVAGVYEDKTQAIGGSTDQRSRDSKEVLFHQLKKRVSDVGASED